MQQFIILSLLASTFALPQGYVFQFPSNPLQPIGPPNNEPSPDIFGEGHQTPSQGQPGSLEEDHADKCPDSQILNVDGACVQPEVSQTIFVYDAPQQHFDETQAPEVPKPKLNYNIVFVRIPEGQSDKDPIVVPPPQQKTLVYVLSKSTGNQGPQVIEVPAGPQQQPEVYYINYKEGENPQLPIGVDLQRALSSASAQHGQVIGGNDAEINVEGQTIDDGGETGSFGGNQFPASPPIPSNLYGSPQNK